MAPENACEPILTPVSAEPTDTTASAAQTRSEGWTWLFNATKFHYIRDGRSLCGRWGAFKIVDWQDDLPQDTPSPDECMGCWRIRQKERAKTVKAP